MTVLAFHHDQGIALAFCIVDRKDDNRPIVAHNIAHHFPAILKNFVGVYAEERTVIAQLR
jgi:hypothetical protein